MSWGLATVGASLSGLAQIKSAPGQWKVATRATAMTAITVGVVWLALGKELALLAITGSFIGNTASARPWRARLHILAWMDLAYIAGCAIAVVIGSNPVLLTLTLTAIAMTAVLGYNAVMADPPGPMFLIMGPAIASYLPTVGVDKWQVIAVCVLSCLTASIATLALHPRADSAEAQAVDAAREAVEELIEQAAQPDTTDLEIAHLRDTAYAQVLSASMTLEEAAGRNARASAWRSLLVDLRRLHFQVIGQVASRSLPGAVVEVDAAAQRRYLGAPPVKYLLRWALSPRSLPWLASRRIGMAIALTCAVSYGLDLRHPFWAVMTTALVMSLGTDRLSLTHRGLHRMIGTVAGTVAFVGLHHLDATLEVTIAICLALVFMVQWTAVRNYAIAAFFVTPMALLVTTSTAPGHAIGTVIKERILETLIGVAVSLVVMWVTDRRAPIALVRRQYRRVLRVTADLLDLIATDQEKSEAGYRVRRDLAYEQLQAGRILQIAQQDLPVTLSAWSRVEVTVNQLAYTALVACWIRNPKKYLDAAAMATCLRAVIRDLPPVGTSPIDGDELCDRVDEVLRTGSPKIVTPSVPQDAPAE
ncbi:FUSC family protein [Yimella sp. cx-51]|uniref:FUSC family protein n=1 Tax=Yimella sp. cx-51 TaxID=2770551 RepID=UPI00165D8D31|nr:FUSC family protein [Yimella sp. cx-51]MBC9956118.1 FUSC family protein [Yimella sp. cx-51]QTH37352.1 FUSC family protein [Yimella sp. cx-51]